MTCTVGTAPEEVCRFFEAPETAEFVIIQHIRRTEEDVIAVSLGYLPEKYAEKMHGAIPQSLFAFLEESEGIYISRASTELFIPAENDPLCEMLRLREGQSAFRLQTVSLRLARQPDAVFGRLSAQRPVSFHDHENTAVKTAWTEPYSANRIEVLFFF